jgi:predicted TIM-barrel fold metal-dependent hydrolase
VPTEEPGQPSMEWLLISENPIGLEPWRPVPMTQTVRKLSPPPDRNPRKPRLSIPSGACDCHFHVFGPQKRFPLHPDIPVSVEDATYDQFLHLQDVLGFSRGILVQSGLHMWSYEHLLHFLHRDPKRLRGVAIVHPAVTDGEIELLTQAGVRGARFYPGISEPDGKLQARLAEFGWLSHYLTRGQETLAQWKDRILDAPGNFVIEHSGFQDPAQGLNGPGFRMILELLETGRCWIKLSPRFSNRPMLPFSDTLPFIHDLIHRAPDRMLWGSDWPHPSYFNPMPNDGDLVDLLLDWAPDESVRRKILVDNPAFLFGFPEGSQ